MRFERIAAFAIGLLLPVLETCRRGIGHWRVDFTTMFEDYVAGALLLIGAWAAYRRRVWGPMFLVLAWAYLAGLVSGGFVRTGTPYETAVDNTFAEALIEQDPPMLAP